MTVGQTFKQVEKSAALAVDGSGGSRRGARRQVPVLSRPSRAARAALLVGGVANAAHFGGSGAPDMRARGTFWGGAAHAALCGVFGCEIYGFRF